MSEFEYNEYGRCIRMDGRTDREWAAIERQDEVDRDLKYQAQEMADKMAHDAHDCGYDDLDSESQTALYSECYDIIYENWIEACERRVEMSHGR